MKGLPFVLAFTAMTFIAWGAYGPVLHHGNSSMGGNDAMRAFVGVGLAYFFIAVLFPIYILRTVGENGKWTVSGTFYSLVAGGVGAIGALGVILALSYGGNAVYVMPLVFGFAPIVNTLVTAWMSKTFDQVSPVFTFGIILAAIGAGGVVAFKPVKPHANPHSEEDKSQEKEDASTSSSRRSTHFVAFPTQEAQDDLPPVVIQPEPPKMAPAKSIAAIETPKPVPVATEPTKAVETPKAEPTKPVTETVSKESAAKESVPTSENKAVETPSVKSTEKIEQKPLALTTQEAKQAEKVNASEKAELTQSEEPVSNRESNDPKEEPKEAAAKSATAPNVPMIIVSILVAALCWGSYGPMLHQGQARMAGSRLRPFTCVGISYFIIAVAAPLALIANRTVDHGSWTGSGIAWSIAAGTAGALGALGVILAFNAGGKPYYVMPLVFGFAPVINTSISLTENGTWGSVNIGFWISLAIVIAGAITVLTNAPKPKPH
jgi:hypothetical protein